MKVDEKIAKYGTISLSNEELLSVLIKNEKVKTLLTQYELCETCEADTLRIAMLPVEDLIYRGGLTKLEAARVAAGIELGIRIASADSFYSGEKQKCSSPTAIYHYLAPRLRRLDKEIFGVLLLNTKNFIIGSKIIYQGGLKSCQVETSGVFKYAVTNSAAAMIIYHNHPSGNPEPSREDFGITKLFVAAGQVMNIPVLDHLVIGENSYYSFQEECEL